MLRNFLEALGQDVAYSVRLLRRSPGFAVVAIFTIALGIGATTTIFTLINALLLRSIPVRDPQQLVVLSDPAAAGLMNGVTMGERTLFSYHEFEGLRDQNQVFSALFATDSQSRSAPLALTPAEQGSATNMLLVSGGYFSVLGVEPLLGRTFGVEVDTGIGAHPVAVVSDAFWRQRLQADPAVIGRKLRVRQIVFDVIAVLRPSFAGIKVGDSPDVWIPLTMRAAIFTGLNVLAWNPGSITKIMFLQLVGRLRPGVSLEQANASINVTYRQILQAEAGTIADEGQRKQVLNAFIVARDGRRGLSTIRQSYAKPLDVLMGLVALLLVLACANVANLLLARATGRNREIAVRVAIGAGRARVVQQLMTESVLIAMIGGAVGLLLARWADALLLRMVSTGSTLLPVDIRADAMVMAFTLAVTLLTGVLFGLAPALRTTDVKGVNLVVSLRGTSRSILGGGRGSGRLPIGKLLVGTQVAISLLLLVAAGLFVRSLQNLKSETFGYEPTQMLLFRLLPTTAGYRGAALNQLLRDLTQKFSAIPGVRGVTLSDNGLFFGRDSGDQISVLGQAPQSGQNMEASWDQVGPNYFTTIGIPVLMGRDVTERDSTGPHACWLNQTMSRYYFGDANPIGRQIRDDYPETLYTCEIVGVVGDARYNSIRETTPRRFYVPYFNPIDPSLDPTFEIRIASGGDTSIGAAVREAIRQTNPALDLPDIRTIALQVDGQLLRDRLTARLSVVCGGLAMLLACIGLYGVMSYNVAGRTSELGVRMALGAHRSGILGLVLREALVVTMIGAVVGLAFAVAATRIIQSLLFGLTARDPLTFAGAAVLLVGVAACAAVIPAWRASHVEPMVALRYE
jgi:predicted permease